MKIVGAVCLIAATCTAAGQTTMSQVFESVRAPHDVELSANPQEAFWLGAIPTYAVSDSHGIAVPGHQTEVRSRWTSDNLYLLFICPYQELYLKPSPDTKVETNELWNWDVAELFIGADYSDIKRYKEFEVSPQGEWIDLDINLARPHHEVGWTWSSGFHFAARIDREKHIWYAAMRIPFRSIDGRKPAVGNVFRANLFRSQGPPERRKSIAWSAPMTDTFHTPERFGTLKLVQQNKLSLGSGLCWIGWLRTLEFALPRSTRPRFC